MAISIFIFIQNFEIPEKLLKKGEQITHTIDLSFIFLIMFDILVPPCFKSLSTRSFSSIVGSFIKIDGILAQASALSLMRSIQGKTSVSLADQRQNEVATVFGDFPLLLVLVPVYK